MPRWTFYSASNQTDVCRMELLLCIELNCCCMPNRTAFVAEYWIVVSSEVNFQGFWCGPEKHHEQIDTLWKRRWNTFYELTRTRQTECVEKYPLFTFSAGRETPLVWKARIDNAANSKICGLQADLGSILPYPTVWELCLHSSLNWPSQKTLLPLSFCHF